MRWQVFYYVIPISLTVLTAFLLVLSPITNFLLRLKGKGQPGDVAQPKTFAQKEKLRGFSLASDFTPYIEALREAEETAKLRKQVETATRLSEMHQFLENVPAESRKIEEISGHFEQI